MKLTRFGDRRRRPGTILPMLGVCLIGLFGFVALAVDLGMLAVSRTQSQNGADVAALVGTRTLNNKDGVAYSNLPAAITALKSAATNNPHLSANFTNGQITKIEANQYLYNTTSQRFEAVEANWVDVTSTGGAMSAPGGGSWTALRVTISVAQPTYFMRVFGVTTMPSGARATAVYRPRDIAFVLDVTGSMAFASRFADGGESLNPDTVTPRAGHYVANQSALIANANVVIGSGEVYSRNNYTITTPAGPPIARNFYFDPTNINTPATLAYPLTTKANGDPNLLNAFHRWTPPETPGNSDTYTPSTFNWTGYDPTHKGNEASPKGPVPAPPWFGTMTDSGGIAYAGDRWRRGNGSIDKTNTSWATGSSATRTAYHAADLLGYGDGSGGGTPPSTTPSFTTDWLNFRDPVWERYGYDLNVSQYRTQRAGGAPMNPTTYLSNNSNNVNNILVPTADRFQGWSMGPGYWGKTFFMWPPDPRWGNADGTGTADPTSPAAFSASDPAPRDTSGKYICDWRRRFFFNKSGGQLNPQADADGSTTGTQNINEATLNTGTSGQTMVLNTSQVNYAAVLKWIKSGPQVLPPNLRAGRVLYYASIPDNVTTNGTTQADLDKAFWKNYIDFVLGTGNYTAEANLYGRADRWPSGATVTGSDLTTYKFSFEPNGSDKRPTMRYTDSPLRPRLHMWFGPLSMMGFINRASGGSDNWMAGTTYEAQTWQLKAGVNSALDDVKANHPNDYAGLTLFSSNHNGVRVSVSQNFNRIKNGLFYPNRDIGGANLLNKIDAGDVTTEYRPFNTTGLGGYTDSVIPNGSGSTDPSTGLAYAFNMLSSSTHGSAPAGTGGGRRGAQKIIILETDGVPNYARTLAFNQRGFNSYYGVTGGASQTQGGSTVQNHSFDVIKQIVKQTANTSTTGGTTGEDSGLSLPNAPARVYPIAFGDLFDEDLAPSASGRPTAHAFLAKCAEWGGTGAAGATTVADERVITGPYQQRITRLRDCLERIFQGGVSVVLVE